MRPILQTNAILFLGQNIKFDINVLRAACDITVSNVYDTMVTERLLQAGLRESAALDALVLKYLDRPMDKSLQKSFQNFSGYFSNSQYEYSAKDVEVLFPIRERQLTRIRDAGLGAVLDLESSLVPVIADMEFTGVFLDRDIWTKLVEYSEQELIAYRYKLTKTMSYGGYQLGLFEGFVSGLNLDSSDQVLRAFHEKGINVPDTNNITLLDYMRESELANRNLDRVALIKELLTYRQFTKNLSTYGTSFLDNINSHTGFVHTSFNQVGGETREVATGRLSSNNPNLQNIPTRSYGDLSFRSAFRAREGNSFVGADLSQIELRIMAEFSGETALIDAFNTGADIHKLTASRMFGIPLDEVTKEQRGLGKTLNFSTLYGASGPKIATLLYENGTVVTIEKASQLLDSFKKGYPAIFRWTDRTGNEAVSSRETRTALGRRRSFIPPDYFDPYYRKKLAALKREAANQPIQGTSAEILKIAMVEIAKRFKKLNAHLILSVHDELIAEVKDAYVQEATAILKEELEGAGARFLHSVPVLAEPAITKYWSKG